VTAALVRPIIHSSKGDAMSDIETNPLPFGWTEHENRWLIHDETHARPVPALTGPATIRRVAFMSNDRGRDLAQLQRRMAELAKIPAGKAAGARQLDFQCNGHAVVWEMHNEFATLTWKSLLGDTTAWPMGIGLELHTDVALVSATRVDVIDDDSIDPARLAQLAENSLCHSAIYVGQARIATDFVADADRFVSFIVAARSCGDQRRGVIVRRLLEIETYRCFALLGLPVARQVGGRVQGYEQGLAAIMTEIGEGSTPEAHQTSLEALHALSVEVGRTVEETSFRFAATQAYGQIIAERLARLGEDPIGESTTVRRYLDNRVQPALATCRAMEKRLTDLGTKVQRSIELLDATITVSIQTQNQEVLDTILRTAQSQYRLQETVEGLSIIAISYYALGILGYVAEGLHDVLPIDKAVLLTVLAPVVIMVVFFGIRRLRRTIHNGPQRVDPKSVPARQRQSGR
jgi:uncharacterized membrane-anchored protein